jgi:hypothetical protein
MDMNIEMEMNMVMGMDMQIVHSLVTKNELQQQTQFIGLKG